MLEKNSVLFGTLFGIIIPIVTFGVLYGVFEAFEMLGWSSSAGFRPMFRERTIGIIAIGMNAILLNSFTKKRLYSTVRGIVLSTFLWIGVWLFVFGDIVL